jgi:hypothetical protein
MIQSLMELQIYRTICFPRLKYDLACHVQTCQNPRTSGHPLTNLDFVPGTSLGTFPRPPYLAYRLRFPSYILPVKRSSNGTICAPVTIAIVLRKMTFAAFPIWSCHKSIYLFNCVAHEDVELIRPEFISSSLPVDYEIDHQLTCTGIF